MNSNTKLKPLNHKKSLNNQTPNATVADTKPAMQKQTVTATTQRKPTSDLQV